MTPAVVHSEAAQAIGRGAVYMLVAHALAYPSDRRLTGLREGLAPAIAGMEVGDEAVDRALQDLLAALDSPNAELRSAHVQQFTHITSPDCPAHETAYSERDVFRQAQQMADIAGFYRAWGFDVGGEERERPDQICVELEFMAMLARKEALAIERGRRDDLQESRRSQTLFLQEHLACWGASLGRRIAGQAAAPFYRGAGELLAGWIEYEADLLDVAPARALDEPLPQLPPDADEGCGVPDACVPGAEELAFVELGEIR